MYLFENNIGGTKQNASLKNVVFDFGFVLSIIKRILVDSGKPEW